MQNIIIKNINSKKRTISLRSNLILSDELWADTTSWGEKSFPQSIELIPNSD